MKIVPGKLEATAGSGLGHHHEYRAEGRVPDQPGLREHMIAQKAGVIVNIASIAGLFPYNWAGAYSAW